jgi:hypothetical protein
MKRRILPRLARIEGCKYSRPEIRQLLVVSSQWFVFGDAFRLNNDCPFEAKSIIEK